MIFAFFGPVFALLVLLAFAVGVTMERGTFTFLPAPTKSLLRQVEKWRRESKDNLYLFEKEVRMNVKRQKEIDILSNQIYDLSHEIRDLKKMNKKLREAENFVIQELPF